MLTGEGVDPEQHPWAAAAAAHGADVLDEVCRALEWSRAERLVPALRELARTWVSAEPWTDRRACGESLLGLLAAADLPDTPARDQRDTDHQTDALTRGSGHEPIGAPAP